MLWNRIWLREGENGGSPAPAEPTIEDILRADPFSGEREDDPPPPTEPEEVEDPPAPVQDPPPAPPAPVTDVPPVQPQQDLVAALREVMAERPAPAKPAAPQPRFNIQQLPQQVVDAVRSDDPAEANKALAALMNGVMNTMFAAVESHLETSFRPQVQRMLTSHISQTTEAQRIQNDFYSANPELNDPSVRPFVAFTAAMMIQEAGKGFKGWTPEFAKAVSDRVKGFIKTAAPAPTAPAKKQFQANGSGARQAPVKTEATDIMETLFGA